MSSHKSVSLLTRIGITLDYYGTLETTLVQGSSSTTLNLRLSGVPVGKEDEAVRSHLPEGVTF